MSNDLQHDFLLVNFKFQISMENNMGDKGSLGMVILFDLDDGTKIIFHNAKTSVAHNLIQMFYHIQNPKN